MDDRFSVGDLVRITRPGELQGRVGRIGRRAASASPWVWVVDSLRGDPLWSTAVNDGDIEPHSLAGDNEQPPGDDTVMDAPQLERSRVFRTVIAVEIIVTVDGDRVVTIDNDVDSPWLRLDTDDGVNGRVEPDAMIRGALAEAGDFHITITPGATKVSLIEELTA